MSRRKATAPALGAATRSVESERSEKITCVMLERHAAYLDLISVMIRMRHQKAIARTGIVRSLIEFMLRSGVDYSQFASVADMVVHLVGHFRTITPPGQSLHLLESGLFPPPVRKPASEQKTTRT